MDIRYAGIDALKTSMANPARAWQGNKISARDRLLEKKYTTLHHRPKFKMSAADKFFTIGSCFAREIEYKLAPLGVPLLLWKQGIERKYFESWKGSDESLEADEIYSGVFNKYTTASIAHEVRRTLCDEHFENDGLIELGPDLWFDPHSSGLKLLPLNIALRNRSRIGDAMQKIRAADVVVITLGQTESWIDSTTGIAMNSHPGPAALRRFPDRFVFIDHSYSNTIDQIDRTIHLIRDVCNKNMRVVLTVSPVPFNATFRPQDVLVAHQATKSMLRAVAEEIFRAYDFVDYYPSYEMVINSPRDLAWNEDQMHVRGEMVEHIMKFFYSCYY